MTGETAGARRLLESGISRCRETLREGGRVIAQSGNIRWSGGLLALHSDYGPAGQDKPVNQDYALAWEAKGDPAEQPIRWAAALADGVTSSFRPEWGAELACWNGLAHLVRARSDSDAEIRACSAMDAAGDALVSVAQQIVAGGDQWRPPEEFPATWRKRIERGRLLQTTLTLAWLEGDLLHLAMVGDGGGAVRLRCDGEVEDRLLAGGEQQTSYVHALGPGNQQVEELDHWEQCELEPGATAAMYTDGIRAAVGGCPKPLLDRVTELLRGNPEGNVAELVVKELAASGREELRDNLTLLVACQAAIAADRKRQ